MAFFEVQSQYFTWKHLSQKLMACIGIGSDRTGIQTPGLYPPPLLLLGGAVSLASVYGCEEACPAALLWRVAFVAQVSLK